MREILHDRRIPVKVKRKSRTDVEVRRGKAMRFGGTARLPPKEATAGKPWRSTEPHHDQFRGER